MCVVFCVQCKVVEVVWMVSFFELSLKFCSEMLLRVVFRCWLVVFLDLIWDLFKIVDVIVDVVS